MNKNSNHKKSSRHTMPFVKSLLVALLMVVLGIGTVQAQWTDASTGVTYTPISGTNGLNGENWNYGCDGDITTKHGGSGSGPWYMVLQASEPVRLYGYTIVTANDNATHPGRNPKSWVVEGSNDGSTWTTIASVTGDATMQDVNYTDYDFTCSSTVYYTYIRFYITAKGTGDYMQYSEFQPWGAVEGDPEGTVTTTTGTYVITNGSVYLGGNSTTAINTFNPSTCIWTGTSGGAWQNSAGYYLQMDRYNFALSATSVNLTLQGTESGTTGRKIYDAYSNNRYYYLRYNNGWARGDRQYSASTSESGTNVVFAVTKYTYDAAYVDPTIAGASEIVTNGATRYLMTTIPTYRAGYVDYVFYNNTSHFFNAAETQSLTSAPTMQNYSSYSWSLSSNMSGYATIDAQTGVVNYTTSVPSATVSTVTLTFTFPETTLTATKSVTFQPMSNPTALALAESSVELCYEGDTTTEEVLYTISPTNAYHNITVTSSDPTVANGSIGSRGVLSIALYQTGTTTLTLTPKNTDGTTANSLITTLTVTVKPATATPTFSFDNTTNHVTINCATAGATIYYTHNGSTPNALSSEYSSPFEQSTAATINAIAVATGACESAMGTYTLVKLATPDMEFDAAGTTATFSSTDAGVTFYYNSYDVDNGASNPGNPITNGTAWNTGDANVVFSLNNLCQLATTKASTADTGYINSDVFLRRANSTDMSNRNFVFFYDDGTDVHFMANSNGTITNTTTFTPSTAIWHGEIFANGSTAAQNELGGAFYYEPFIRYSNNGQYLQTYTGCDDYGGLGWESGKLRVTAYPGDSVYFAPRTLPGRGELINYIYYNTDCYSTPLTFHLAYNTSTNSWSRHLSSGVNQYNNDYFTVTYPVEEHGGSGYTLSAGCPTDGSGNPVQLHKGQTLTMTYAVSGSYLPTYYRVGNEVKYFYYYPNTSSPITDGSGNPVTSESQITGIDDIRITYQLLNGTGYVEMTGSTAELVYDPGRDLLVKVLVTATPYDAEGNPIIEGIQTDTCQFTILTDPPFPAPIISNIVGTNQYQITCTASDITGYPVVIEYRIDGESEWHTYTSPLTIVTPGTIIEARSLRNVAAGEVSDPVTYIVGGASLLPPTISVDEGGVVTLTADASNATLDGYTGETWLYTVNGSDPDPDNVGGSNPTQVFSSLTLTNGQTVKVMAIDVNTPAHFIPSVVVVSTYKLASGLDASGYGIVTLNDYEDHEWSYYQASADLPTGYPDAMHSPYPRNAKITYYGYGANTLSQSAVAAPAASTFTVNTAETDVKVGIDDPGHTFVYYKTLERDANGRYPYQLIPNPFYVRPDVRTYTGTKTVTFTLSDAGSDGWGASYLQVDFSNGATTQTIQFTESQASKTATLTVNAGVTITLTWVPGGGNESECSFTVSYDGNTVYSSGTGMRKGPLTAIKVGNSTTVTTYTGFYKWRIKSITDGSIYSVATGGTALAAGDMVDAETIYYFDPDDNAETNVHNITSMEVELEALWAPAEVKTSGSFSNGYNSVERNFYVGLSGTGSNVFALSTPCTYSSFYPNGTTDGNTIATLANRKTIGVAAAQTDSKVEYYIIQGNNNYRTLNAAGKNVTIGRGVTMNANNIAVQGMGTSGVMNQILRIESGQYTTFTSYTANPTSVTRHWVVLGSDYDRAKSDNSKLTFTGKFLTGEGRTLGLSSTDEMARVWSKSGNFMTGVSISDAAAANSYYIGVTNTHNNGHRYLEIEGGEWYANIAGGMGENHTSTEPGFTLRIKGGTVRGSIYGAAAWAMAGGTRKYVITGGKIGGWVAGGANGTSTEEGRLSGATFIYLGGNASVDSKYQSGPSGTTSSNSVINRAVGGNVFGAGCGYSGTSSSGQVTLGTNVAIADNAYIERGVYGGGSYGYTTATSNIYILGGTVNGSMGGVNGTSYLATINGGVFGGACQNQGGTVNIYMTGGLVKGGLYGGSNYTGTIANDVTIQIDGGQVGANATNTANVHGGGLGNATRVTGNVDITIGTAAGAATYATIYGDVYGGSAMGYVNGESVSTTKHTNVTLNAGKIYGSLYGGGLGTAAYAANVYAPVQVTVNGGGIHTTSNMGSGAVYGCNNVNGAPQSTVKVDIYGTDTAADGYSYALDAVYGGGNAADYSGTPQVTIHNCNNSIEYVYGGGNAADVGGTNTTIYGGDSIGYVFGGGNGSVTAANVTGNVVLNIRGGKILHVFGGNNTSGTIGGTITLDVAKEGDTDPNGTATACAMKIGELFSGGNMAASNVGQMTIGCTGDYVADDGTTRGYGYDLEGIGDVYGGANKANVTGDITLTINGGVINRVFGGNNMSGEVSGTITVIIDRDEDCGWYVGYVYGGGNQATYEAPSNGFPYVKVKNGLVTYDVYGAGYGDLYDDAKGVVEGNPKVEIIENGLVGRNVFGGGNAAAVTGNTSVTIDAANSTTPHVGNNVFGGGNQAMISGNTNVTILNKSVIGNNVYGGGNQGKVTGNTNVQIGD